MNARIPSWPIVVCVDDEPEVLASLKRSLRNETYEVLTTESADRALEWAGEQHVSVAISDHRMPGTTGVELMALLKARSPGTARILLTAHPDAAREASRAGLTIDRLLLKPWDDHELRRTIRKILYGRSPREAVHARLDCRGLNAEDVVALAVPACREAVTSGSRPVLLIEHATLVGGSLSGLFFGLARMAEELGTPVTLLEESGYGAAFLDSVGKGLPLEVRHPLNGITH